MYVSFLHNCQLLLLLYIPHCFFGLEARHEFCSHRNLSKIRLRENDSPFYLVVNEIAIGSTVINMAHCHWWMPKNRLLRHAGEHKTASLFQSGGTIRHVANFNLKPGSCDNLFYRCLFTLCNTIHDLCFCFVYLSFTDYQHFATKNPNRLIED